MRITLITSLYATNEISGADKVATVLAKGLVQRGHQVAVVCLSLDGADRSFERHGVTVHQLKQQNIYSPWPSASHHYLSRVAWHSLDIINPFMINRVGTILEWEQPDVVHSHLLAGFTLAPWLAVKRSATGLVHTIHDWYLRCLNSAMYRGEQQCTQPCAMCRAYRLPHRWLSNSVDIAVGVSDFILRQHLDAGYFQQSRAHRVIFNSFDGTIRRPRSGPRGGPLRLGFLGRLSPAKGVATLLDSLRALGRNGWELIVGGSGAPAFEDALKKQHADPKITFLGHTNPTEFFPRIDALVVPSLWHEPGRPLVILEAYGNGVPVIASRRGGIAEVVEEGRTGYLFEPNVSGQLASIISRLVDDRSPLQAMHDNCIETAGLYTNERMIDDYLDIYREAAEICRLNAIHKQAYGAVI